MFTDSGTGPARKLGQILLDMNCITIRQLTAAIIGQRTTREAGQRRLLLGEQLVELGAITVIQLTNALRQQELENQNFEPQRELTSSFHELRTTLRKNRRHSTSITKVERTSLFETLLQKLKGALESIG